MAEQLVELNVTGMHCNNCALSIHKLLEKKGLRDILVDFAGEEVKFSNSNGADLPSIIKDIEGLGYKVVDDPALQVTPFYDKVENKFIFCAILTAPLLLHMVLPWHFLHRGKTTDFEHRLERDLSLPKMASGLDWQGRAESSHHFGR